MHAGADALTITMPVAPVAATVSEPGEIEKVHGGGGGAACATVKACPPIAIAVVLAVQVQSRLVEIDRELAIPSAGAASRAAFSTATSHFAAVGDVTEIDEDVPLQAVARNQSAQIANSRARWRAKPGASSLPGRAVRAQHEFPEEL